MKVMQLPGFGIERLEIVDSDVPKPRSGQVLVRFKAAALNYRDFQIISGDFTPNVTFPLIPLSDGAGQIVAVGEGVTELQTGDRVTPLFFPKWLSGEALRGERSVSSGLEVPGVAREYGVYDQTEVVKMASHLNYLEAACFPCAGLTAWTSLVTISGIKRGDTVLVQGTGGVALFALQFAKALGANVVTISSSDAKLARAKALGADHCINYRVTPQWGPIAFELADGRGVDAVIEIGGTGTLENSVQAIRHGGHVPIIGYLAGAQIGLTVYSLIQKNANFHGVGVGNRHDYKQMMDFVETHKIRPVVDKTFGFAEVDRGLRELAEGGHFGKLAVEIQAD